MKTMDIYAKPGTKVVFSGQNGYDSENKLANEILTVGGTYTVESTDVGGWITYVKLKEFPGHKFNSVMFIDYWNAADRKHTPVQKAPVPTSVEIFNFESHQLRTVQVNEEILFVAADVCTILEIGNTSDALRRLDDDEKGVGLIDTPGGHQMLKLVNEFGLYSLVLGSRKPEAKKFKRWVTHDVLPSIRKTGSYDAVQQPHSGAEMLLEMAKQFVEQEKRVERVEIELQETRSRIDSIDNVDTIGDKQQRLVAMVKKVAHRNGWSFQKAWREFTGAFNVAYRTNLMGRIEHYQKKHGLPDLTRPQYLSMVSQLDDAIRVADKMLNQPTLLGV